MARSAKQTRPQVVCVLADNNGSMAGDKAHAATQGIREMIMACQSRGPSGPDRSYFKLLLIRFGDCAEVDPACDMSPVRQIDPDSITIAGDGGQTNLTDALQVTLDRLRPYMQSLETHPERADHPLPIVIIFSDGEHNQTAPPQPVADAIKKLSLDGETVVIAALVWPLTANRMKQPCARSRRRIVMCRSRVPPCWTGSSVQSAVPGPRARRMWRR